MIFRNFKSLVEINECRIFVFKRIFNLINQCDESETYKKEFYEECPDLYKMMIYFICLKHLIG